MANACELATANADGTVLLHGLAGKKHEEMTRYKQALAILTGLPGKNDATFSTFTVTPPIYATP